MGEYFAIRGEPDSNVVHQIRLLSSRINDKVIVNTGLNTETW